MSQTIFALVTTTHKYRHKTDAIAETWGSKIDTILYLSDRDIGVENYLNCTNDDSYHSHVVKLRAGIRRAIERPAHDWYFMSCDETYVNVPNLRRYFADKLPSVKAAYGFMQNSWAQDLTLRYPSGGAGTVVGRQVLEELDQIFETIQLQGEGLGDVWIGKYLRYLGIELIHSNDFNPCSQHDPLTYITAHKSSPEYMRQLHQEIYG